MRSFITDTLLRMIRKDQMGRYVMLTEKIHIKIRARNSGNKDRLEVLELTDGTDDKSFNILVHRE
jgi:hypothetical protein